MRAPNEVQSFAFAQRKVWRLWGRLAAEYPDRPHCKLVKQGSKQLLEEATSDEVTSARLTSTFQRIVRNAAQLSKITSDSTPE